MGLFDKFKTSTAIDRLSEEKLYEQGAHKLKEISMNLKRLVLILTLYSSASSAVNLVCQADSNTSYDESYIVDCSRGCESKSNEMFSIVFDSSNNKIIEVTDFTIYSGEGFYREEVTPSYVSFQLPNILSSHKDRYIAIDINRTSGEFGAYTQSGSKIYRGKCQVGKKLF